MSIAPPSDVILDVAQAADPQKVRAATARLVQLGAGVPAGTGDFAAQLASAGQSSATVTRAAPPLSASGVKVETHRGSPYEKFEAMMLQNFIEAILPKDSDLFGDATSADAYRSMLADQLATELAKSGRIGVAKAIERAESGHGPETRTAPPALQSTGASDLPTGRASASTTS